MKVLNDTSALDAACAGCQGRRDFLRQGAAAIAAFALAGCGLSETTAPTSLSPTTLTLTNYPALNTVGGVVTLSVDGSPVAVVRETSTTVAAFSLICPHQGNTVQKVTNGFYCPGHGATFNIQGAWTGGERTSSLHSYPATLDTTAGTVTLG